MTDDELEAKISIEPRGKGKQAHLVASCPFCSEWAASDILATYHLSEWNAKNKILNHIKVHHKERIA